MRERRSFGVACCRTGGKNNRIEILLMRNRCTYAFVMIAHGKYNPHDTNALVELLSGTTVDEKHDILSLNFLQIWYRVYLNSEHNASSYFVAKNKFENTFVADGGVRVRKLVIAARHGYLVWEIPKGRKHNKNESDIHCAIREFGEETGISKSAYQIYPSATRSFSHVDADTRYTNTYFIARACVDIVPRVSFASHEQMVEVGDIRWMNIEEIRALGDARLSAFVPSVLEYVKRKSK